MADKNDPGEAVIGCGILVAGCGCLIVFVCACLLIAALCIKGVLWLFN